MFLKYISMTTNGSSPKIYRLQSWVGYNEDEDFCEEYVRYYNDKDFIYLVSIERDSRERFCRIRTSQKNKKYIKYNSWEEYNTYTYGIDEIRMYDKL